MNLTEAVYIQWCHVEREMESKADSSVRCMLEYLIEDIGFCAWHCLIARMALGQLTPQRIRKVNGRIYTGYIVWFGVGRCSSVRTKSISAF